MRAALITILVMSAGGGPMGAAGGQNLRLEYVECRPAVWETEHVQEYESERPNEGGLVYAYARNVGETPLRLRGWRLNGRDGASWRMAGQVVWDRLAPEQLAPGQVAVLEVCGVTPDFRPGQPCALGFSTEDWRRGARVQTEFRHDPVQIALIRALPGLQAVEVHLRNDGVKSAQVGEPAVEGVGSEGVELRAPTVLPGMTTIARVKLARALTPGELVIVSAPIIEGAATRTIYAHRRAYEDVFPIGTWGADESRYTVQRQHHIDTCVRGADPSDPLLTHDAARFGYRALVHTGIFPNIDGIRGLRENPHVSCWMPHDEPDWTKPPQWLYLSTEITRQEGPQKPILLTLCRNVKFFEYAGLADIPCMDHYSVTAPSSSRWPTPYGTRLEETAYYTRDLKVAAEPKPVWVWTQGLHLWDERPKRPIPTPAELAAQLILNLGRGAKGILWFTFSEEAGARYPDVQAAVQQWGRVLELARPHLLGAEPYDAQPIAPERVDVAALAAWDRVFLAVTNLDYEIHDEAYPFTPARAVTLSLRYPEWAPPVAALALDPDGVRRLPCRTADGRAVVEIGDLEVCRLLVLVTTEADLAAYEQAYLDTLAQETREY